MTTTSSENDSPSAQQTTLNLVYHVLRILFGRGLLVKTGVQLLDSETAGSQRRTIRAQLKEGVAVGCVWINAGNELLFRFGQGSLFLHCQSNPSLLREQLQETDRLSRNQALCRMVLEEIQAAGITAGLADKQHGLAVEIPQVGDPLERIGFTEYAQKALQIATDRAAQLGLKESPVECLLMGIHCQGAPVTRVWDEYFGHVDNLRNAFTQQQLRDGQIIGMFRRPSAQPPFNSEVRQIFEHARKECFEQGVEAVTTAHLLMALLKHSPCAKEFLAALLRKNNLELQYLRNATVSLMRKDC
jgi:hypothetical protein